MATIYADIDGFTTEGIKLNAEGFTKTIDIVEKTAWDEYFDWENDPGTDDWSYSYSASNRTKYLDNTFTNAVINGTTSVSTTQQDIFLVDDTNPGGQWSHIESKYGQISYNFNSEKYSGVVNKIEWRIQTDGKFTSSWEATGGTWDPEALIVAGTGQEYHSILTAGGDEINGSSMADQIDSGDGDDQVFGKGGKDFLTGGRGQDKIYGGDEDDQIFDGYGKNVFYGEQGADRFYVQPNTAGYWTRTPTEADNIFLTRTVKVKKGRSKKKKKKVTEFLVDNNFNRIADFSLGQGDVLMYKGGAGKYGAFDSNLGVAVYETAETNIVAVLDNLTKAQVMGSILNESW